jgi:hypothetical protein
MARQFQKQMPQTVPLMQEARFAICTQSYRYMIVFNETSNKLFHLIFVTFLSNSLEDLVG